MQGIALALSEFCLWVLTTQYLVYTTQGGAKVALSEPQAGGYELTFQESSLVIQVRLLSHTCRSCCFTHEDVLGMHFVLVKVESMTGIYDVSRSQCNEIRIGRFVDARSRLSDHRFGISGECISLQAPPQPLQNPLARSSPPKNKPHKEAYSASSVRSLASGLVTLIASCSALSTIAFLLRVDTLCAISAKSQCGSQHTRKRAKMLTFWSKRVMRERR